MATHDYVINNQSASAFRADLNSVLQAIVTQNSGATAPSTTYANMLWYDSAVDRLKKRNEADSGWIVLGTIDEGAGTFTQSGERSLASNAQAIAGTDNTVVMTPLRTAAAIANLSTFTQSYVSTNQTITSGGLLTLAHGMGTAPKLVMLELICLTAEFNYGVSDVVMVGLNNTTSGSNRSNTIYYNATNVLVRFSDLGGCFAGGNKTTGSSVVFTNTNWNLRVRAFA